MAEIKRFSILVILFSLGSCSYCARNIAPLEFKGIISRRYIDSTYKNLPLILVNVGSGIKEIMVSPAGRDTVSLYQHVQVGDSLIKKKGSYSFKVIRNGEINYYSMNCNPK